MGPRRRQLPHLLAHAEIAVGFILASPAAWPATVTLNNLIGTTTVNYSELMAGAVLVAAPTVLLYLVLGKFFVGGLTAGAVK